MRPPAARDARELAEARFAAAVRREVARASKLPGGPPWGRDVSGAPSSPRGFVEWARARSPGALQRALDGSAGRPVKPRLVSPVQDLSGLPRVVWHGTQLVDRFLLDGVRAPPAIDMGMRGRRGWGWVSGYAWAGIAMRWYGSLTPAGRASLLAQTGGRAGAVTESELGRRVSLLFAMRADPIYALAYSLSPGQRPEDGVVLELDTSRLPVFGFFEDPYVMGDPVAIVLPARGFQGGPDAVVGLRRPGRPARR